ncbi:hypothetical protein TNCV_4443251 [Trichonephila clavipes]|nr:hypothetical protein TNCV_4443251 [Trichonephila clavipes]
MSTVPIAVFVTLDAEVHELMFRSGAPSPEIARSGDRGGQAVGRDQLITRASVNAFLNNSWTELTMRGGAPSCMNMVSCRQPRCWKIGIA